MGSSGDVTSFQLPVILVPLKTQGTLTSGDAAFDDAVLFSGRCSLHFFFQLQQVVPGHQHKFCIILGLVLFPWMANQSEWIGQNNCLQISSFVLLFPLARLQLQLPTLLGKAAEG